MKTIVIRVSALSSLMALPFLAGCSSDLADKEQEPAAAESALENAPEDTNNKFSVGVCNGGLTGGTSGTCVRGRCTGTLIAPNLVLTAQHCVNAPTASALTELCTNTVDNYFDPNTVKPVSLMRVTTSPSVAEGNPTWYEVAEVMLPGRHICHDDIALLRLKTNVPASDTKPIAADVYTDLAVHTPNAVTMVGRGAIQTRWNPDTGEQVLFDSGMYRRRILQNIPVLCVSNTDGACGTLFDYTILDPPRGFTLTKGVILIGPASHPGDSGTGLLDQARFDRGKPTVIGVNSYGGVNDKGIEYAGFAVRLTQHADWIVKEAKGAASAGGYPVPEWTRKPNPDADTHD